MSSLRPLTKVAIIFAGLALAFGLAVVAIFIRQRLVDGPDALASSGMHAFGDLLLGLAVLGLLSLAPAALALYWLRPVKRLWPALAGGAALLALTGPVAVLMSHGWRAGAGQWALLADARIGLMLLFAPTFFICGLFSPQRAPRWVLISAATCEAGMFAAVVVIRL